MRQRSTNEPDTFGVAPVSRDTLSDRVYLELKRSIMSGGLLPGAVVTIRGLSRSMGVSLMPVRETVRRLTAERALEMLPNRSFALPVLTPEVFQEIRRIRISLEGMATEVAAGRISPAELAELKALDKKMSRFRGSKISEYLAIHKDFHFTIYEASRMSTLMPILESLWLQIGPLLHHVMTPERLQICTNLHSSAVEALEKADGAAARAAIETDIMDAGEVILNLMQSSTPSASRLSQVS